MNDGRTERRWLAAETPPLYPAPVDAPEPNAPPGWSPRHVAGVFLAEALHAHARLISDEADAEALHDFRVALRKLRAHLRAYRERVGVDERHAERLERISCATSEARDLQVQLAWLEALAAGDIQHASIRSRRAAEALAVTMRAEAAAAEAAARETVGAAFLPAYDLLVAALDKASDDESADGDFAAFPGKAAVRQARRLRKRLRRLDRPRDQDAAHEARIATKRLRYLLEPIAGTTPRADRLIRRLRKLQDALGDMHDVHLLRERVRAAAAAQPEMKPLAKALRRERRRLFRLARARASGPLRRVVRRTRRIVASVHAG